MRNVETARTKSRKPNTIWRLDICYSNRFGLMKRSFNWWWWPTICSCCSRWTSQREWNTGSKSKPFGWNTFSLLERLSERPETWWWNFLRIILIKRYMKKACLRKYHSSCLNPLFLFNLPEKIISDTRICESGSQKLCTMEEMMLNLRQDCQNHHPLRWKCWSNLFDVEFRCNVPFA